MKKVLFSALILGLVFTTSCNKDDDGGGKSCAQRVEDINVAASAFTQDPTVENCEEYKSAVQAYIDADCPVEGGIDYQAVLDGLDCS